LVFLLPCRRVAQYLRIGNTVIARRPFCAHVAVEQVAADRCTTASGNPYEAQRGEVFIKGAVNMDDPAGLPTQSITEEAISSDKSQGN
jgi:hypothetical protein